MRRREERRRGEEGKRKIGIIKDYDYTSTLIEFPSIIISFPYLVLQLMESWIVAWDQLRLPQ